MGKAKDHIIRGTRQYEKYFRANGWVGAGAANVETKFVSTNVTIHDNVLELETNGKRGGGPILVPLRVPFLGPNYPLQAHGRESKGL
jgi:hypothetical protein